MGNCKDCKNWAPLDQEWGSCEKTITIRGSHIDMSSLAFTESEDMSETYLKCHADFGCNQFEAR